MVSPALRRWFVAHFVVDLAFALPLFLAPEWTLRRLGWTVIDPLAARLVAAALFGIGIESWLGRNAGSESFRGMLDLKLIWSATASAGILWSVLAGGPPAAWALLGVFVVFNLVWLRYRVQLGRAAPAVDRFTSESPRSSSTSPT